MNELSLNKDQRTKLLDMCITYYHDTVMNIYNFKNEGYKGHFIAYKKASYEDDTYNSWLFENDNIPKSPSLIFGFEQFEDTAGGLGFRQYVTIHWYELVLNDLMKKMFKNNYLEHINKMFKFKKHPVDYIYKYYLEEINLNILKHE
jgi:hypothetical protein